MLSIPVIIYVNKYVATMRLAFGMLARRTQGILK
jgi:hypothetical protein